MRHLWFLCLLIVAARAGAEPFLIVEEPLLPLPSLENRLDALSYRIDRLDELSGRVLRLEEQSGNSMLSILSNRVDRLEEQSGNQGLLTLHNQVESLKGEVARLRGAQEEMAHALLLADKRQKDVLADFDARLKVLRELAKRPAPVVVATPTEMARPATVAQTAPPPDPEAETKAYEAALNRFKVADHAGAVIAFNDFLAAHPDSPLAGNACYWLGLTYFSMADHKSAVAAQQRLLKDYPQHAKVPDAMVNMARARIQLGETESARMELEQVLARYPGTRSAVLAKKILALFM